MWVKYSFAILTIHAIQIILLCFIQEIPSAVADNMDVSRLRAKILKNYDTQARPNLNHNETTVVRVNFLINSFRVDEKQSMITLNLIPVLTWEDQHVKWDPLEYGNLTEITFPPSELWKPELSLINNFDESEIEHFGETLMIALSTSEIWWLPPSKFQVHCQYDFRLWPYDRQSCKMILAAWTHHGGELDFRINGNYSELLIDEEWQEHYSENRDWKLLGSTVTRKSRIVYCCPEVPLVEIIITIDIERRSNAHTAAITIVGLGIATAILASFWLDPFAQERLPLTLLILLLNSVFLQYMHQAIPNNGSAIPLIICFFRDSLIMVTFAFAWSIGIRYMAKIKRDSPVPLPEFVQTFLKSFAATVLCLNPRPQSKGQTQQTLKEASEGDDGDVSELVREEAGDIQEDWEWLARFLDRIAFFAYLIAYLVFMIAFL